MVDTQAFQARFQAMAKARDALALERLIAPEAALITPNCMEKRRERPLVRRYLEVALFEVDRLTIGRLWSEGEMVLVEFAGRLDDLDVDGIHRITLDAAGEILLLEAFIRPVAAALEIESRSALVEDAETVSSASP